MSGTQLTKLYDPVDGQLLVVAFMSGSGTNNCKLIDLERKLIQEQGSSPYHVVAIFTNSSKSNAVKIGCDYNLPTITLDMNAFYAKRGKTIAEDVDWVVRTEFDAETVRLLEQYQAKVAAFGGYMSIAQKPLLDAFISVNVHPGDLRVLDHNGNRAYTGKHSIPVQKAIMAGELTIRSTTHIVSKVVDDGQILKVSRAMPLELGKAYYTLTKEELQRVATLNQNRLKEWGDWVVFPKTILHIAQGRIAKDDTGLYHFDGVPMPNGIEDGVILRTESRNS